MFLFLVSEGYIGPMGGLGVRPQVSKFEENEPFCDMEAKYDDDMMKMTHD